MPVFNTPQYIIEIDSKQDDKSLVYMSIVATRNVPIVLLDMKLNNLTGIWDNGISVDSEIKVNFGSDAESNENLFTGEVDSFYIRDKAQVTALDYGKKFKTSVSKIYAKEQLATDIVKDIAGLCGYLKFNIDVDETRLSNFTAIDTTGTAVFRNLQRLTEYKAAFWIDRDGTFNWKEKTQATPVSTYTYGNDVLRFGKIPNGNYFMAVMESTAWHSDTVLVKNYDSNGADKYFFVEQVRHSYGIDGKGRRASFILSEF